MKYRICSAALAMLILLTGCGRESGNAESKAFSEALQGTERIVMPDLTGYNRTTLEKIGDLSVYVESEGSNNAITAPIADLEDGALYLVRNFPDGMSTEEMLSWWDGERWGGNRVMEVYRDASDLSEREEIPLDAPQERDSTYTRMRTNADGSFSMTGLLLDTEGNYGNLQLSYSSTGEILYRGDEDCPLSSVPLPDNSVIYLDIPVSDPDEKGPLYRFQPETDSRVTLAENVLCYTLQGDTLYWIDEAMNEDFETTCGLYRCGIEGGFPQKLAEVPPNPYLAGDGTTVFLWMKPESMGYDEVNNVLYYSDFGGVRAFSTASGETADVMKEGRILDMDGSLMLVEHGINQVSLYRTPGLPESIENAGTVLRVASVRGYGESPALLLSMELNGVPVRIESSPEMDPSTGNAYTEYANTMAKKLLAGDTDFDLFWLSAETPTLFKEGYFTDLGSYPLLKSYYDRMPEGLAELCSVGGVPALYPLHLYRTDLAVYTGLAGDNFTPPETFEAFRKFTDSIRVPGRLNLMQVTHIRSAADPWLNQLISNFMEGRGTDEGAQEELTMLLTWALEQYAESEPGKDSVIRTVTGSAGEGYTAFPVPKLNEAYGTPYTGEYLAVNPNSPNRDAAALYLAYKMEEALAGGHQLMDSREDCTGIRAYPTSAYAMDVYALMESCAAGEMTPEEAAAQILREMKMIRDE